MPAALNLLLFVLLAPALLGCSYLLILTLLSRRMPQQLAARKDLRFDIIVPAHNEAGIIKQTLQSLKKLDWPETHYRIIVIADNCTDDTAAIASANGATVLKRHNDTQRGKGYALDHGIRFFLESSPGDAVVVIDADTQVSENLLSCFAARLSSGADAIQAHYGVLNPNDSWRTRLMTIAYSAFHAVRSRGRERLHVSCGLRGNGMCFSRALLLEQPPQVYSLAEDVEYGVLLGLNDVRVHYADEALVLAELPTSGADSASQRQRWEGGRFAVAKAYSGKLLHHALRHRSRISLDLALDLLTLPLAYLCISIAVTACLAGLASLIYPTQFFWLWLCLSLLGALILHVLRGWQLSPLGPAALFDLLRVPFFIAWKLVVMLKQKGNTNWIRTKRNNRH
ncbi:glycosyltransferase family 2 protein [Pusillimonas sp. NJUB218]|uniref:glycosyltransferase family 2 protein n=1 Tax=Pusillimonas sp. NJUB218 TaxID=2023230 RepID=UPI000F4C9BBC|nr:glycosyltransferase family 2 protein [Pusillimonas sp. NJUB218]ROT44759.1 glycosyl transferase family 2 [Pusillimonas sp. NJUB218]